MNIVISIILLALALNFSMITVMFYLDEQEILEWNRYFTIPIGITNGFIIIVYWFGRDKKKEIDSVE